MDAMYFIGGGDYEVRTSKRQGGNSNSVAVEV
jgi:hypothetical protein